MAEDVIPSNDAEFEQFQDHFISKVAPNPAKYGLLTEDVTALQGEQTAWRSALVNHVKAHDDARTATHTKDVVRDRFEAILRGAARKVHGSINIDNGLRASIGLRPRDGARTPIGAPVTRPLGRIELKGRNVFVVHFVDEETPTRLAKPQGVHGCQVWAHVGDAPPRDPSGYVFLALDTRTPYTDEHTAADAGKNAYYLLRWQNAKGEPGPWSEVVTAKIPL